MQFSCPPVALRFAASVTGGRVIEPMRSPFLTALILGLLAGCKPDIPDPIWKGTHLHYSTTRSEPVCRGSFHRQEQHAVGLAQLLGVELSEIIRYTWVSDPEIPDYCEGRYLRGCAYVDDPYVFSLKSFHYHELAHTVANLAGVHGPSPFSEGFAEAFNDGGQPGTERVPIDDVLRNFEFDDQNYYTAGLFARFLIERHGLEIFADFMRSTETDLGFTQFAPIFEDIFGEPLDAAMTEFESYPSCSEMSNRLAIVDCSLPLEPWQDQTVTLTADVACEQDDVLGPASDNLMFTTRGFQVEEAGSYLFFASAPEGWSGFRVVKCGSCWDSFDTTITPGSMEIHDLTPGRYYVLFGRGVDEPAELGLAIGKL
jgi:hypothetical protein